MDKAYKINAIKNPLVDADHDAYCLPFKGKDIFGAYPPHQPHLLAHNPSPYLWCQKTTWHKEPHLHNKCSLTYPTSRRVGWVLPVTLLRLASRHTNYAIGSRNPDHRKERFAPAIPKWHLSILADWIYPSPHQMVTRLPDVTCGSHKSR